VFEQHAIDYCCGGSRSLAEACQAEQMDVQSLLDQLTDVVSQTTSDEDADFASKSLTEMCDSIEATHHAFLRSELPRLTQLVDKVVAVHGDQFSWLHRLAESFRQLRDELGPHMMKEENVLFPAIRSIELSQSVPAFPFGSVDNPIRMMEHEHDAAGQALKELRALSSGFKTPEGGCNTFLAMLDGLHQLELDLHRHIHKENNVLFPGASLAASRGSKT